MKLEIHPRAEIALRSLDKEERKKIRAALVSIENRTLQELFKSKKLQKIKFASGEVFYSYRGSLRLRIILSKKTKVAS